MRFPVATIVKETGLNKGYVSAVLNGKKPISDNFWDTFNKKFPAKDAQPNGAQTSSDPLPGTVTLQDHIAEIQARRQDAERYASKMEAEKDRLYSLLENYLNSIQVNSVKTQEDLAIVKAQADIIIKQIARQDEAILQSQLPKHEIVKGGKVKRGV